MCRRGSQEDKKGEKKMDEFSKNTDALGKKAEEILERAQNGSLNHEIEATLDSVLSSVVSGVSRTAAHMNQEMEKTRRIRRVGLRL